MEYLLKQAPLRGYAKFSRSHAYARRNGYTGCYDEYVKLQYTGYSTICKRCDSKPMTFQQWKDSQ